MLSVWRFYDVSAFLNLPWESQVKDILKISHIFCRNIPYSFHKKRVLPIQRLFFNEVLNKLVDGEKFSIQDILGKIFQLQKRRNYFKRCCQFSGFVYFSSHKLSQGKSVVNSLNKGRPAKFFVGFFNLNNVANIAIIFLTFEKFGVNQGMKILQWEISASYLNILMFFWQIKEKKVLPIKRLLVKFEQNNWETIATVSIE